MDMFTLHHYCPSLRSLTRDLILVTFLCRLLVHYEVYGELNISHTIFAQIKRVETRVIVQLLHVMNGVRAYAFKRSYDVNTKLRHNVMFHEVYMNSLANKDSFGPVLRICFVYVHFGAFAVKTLHLVKGNSPTVTLRFCYFTRRTSMTLISIRSIFVSVHSYSIYVYNLVFKSRSSHELRPLSYPQMVLETPFKRLGTDSLSAMTGVLISPKVRQNIAT